MRPLVPSSASSSHRSPSAWRVPPVIVVLVGLLLTALGPAALAGERRGTVVVPGGVELHYEVEGRGERAVLVPLARIVGDLSMLAEEYTVVSYDPRGRGLSTPFTSELPVTLALDLADLDAVRTHLGLERVSLIGASYYGALVALYAVEHPERVERIVQLCPMAMTAASFATAPAQQEPDEAADARLAELREEGLDESDPEAYCREYKRLHAPQLWVDPKRMSESDLAECGVANERPQSFMAWAGALFSDIGEWDFREQAASVPVPALVVQGEEDRITPPAGARDWLAALPEARLLWVPEAGHVSWKERPELVRPAVLEFLGGSWPEGSATPAP